MDETAFRSFDDTFETLTLIPKTSSNMKTSCILLCIFLLLFSCKKGEKKSPENEASGSAADTTHIPRKPRYYTLDSTTTIAVKPVRGAPSREFRELISIVKKLNYILLNPFRYPSSQHSQGDNYTPGSTCRFLRPSPQCRHW